jgi:ornithine cyclodeaminase/alanine dehydrogenase-like protein (mu-crystallin family)
MTPITSWRTTAASAVTLDKLLADVSAQVGAR